MTTVHARLRGETALVPRQELEELIALARRAGTVDLLLERDEATGEDMMQLADAGGSFRFWREDGESIYSGQDGEPI